MDAHAWTPQPQTKGRKSGPRKRISDAGARV
jgi:hypothetical protein